jgi:hypothetical protein
LVAFSSAGVAQLRAGIVLLRLHYSPAFAGVVRVIA